MKKTLLLLTYTLISFVAFSQTTATDFTANDCNGNSHTLFSELDSGKIIVMVWVMPCGSCVSASLTTYNVVQSYATTNPGKVCYYLVDDNANTSCTSLSNWGASNVGSDITACFSDASISMSDYGSTGMPKIVVIAGSDHTVYYNSNNSVDSDELQTAINTGLSLSSVKNAEIEKNSLSLFPNPTSNKVSIQYALDKQKNTTLEIYSVLGEKVKSVSLGNQNAGTYNYEMNISNLKKGIYFLRCNNSQIKFEVIN